MDKEIKSLVNTLTKQGWSVEQGGSGHYKARNPEGDTMVTMPATPSDPRAIANTIADLKRAGARIERGNEVGAKEPKKRAMRKDTVEVPWLREIRKAKNVSQKDLAEKIRITSNGISVAESNGRMRYANARRAAWALGVDIDEITGKVTPAMFAGRYTKVFSDPVVDIATGKSRTVVNVPPEAEELWEQAKQEKEEAEPVSNVVRHELGPETLKRVDRVLDIFAAIFGGDRPWQG